METTPRDRPIGACTAPSLQFRDAIDARDSSALQPCGDLTTGGERLTRQCGQTGDPRLDVAALDRTVLPLDPKTREHIGAIARYGVTLQRNPRAFGLVGDSMTVAPAFLGAFSANVRGPTRPHVLASELGATLEPIVDFYRGAKVQQIGGAWRDSFRALRAAKVGKRAEWAVTGGEHSPIGMMISDISPAVAVVLFGGNDAASRMLPPEQVAAVFGKNLERVIDALENQGVVPILNTVARHGLHPGIDDCGPLSEMSDWRIAVHTNAVSAQVVEIACRRKLPLIDLRAAMDTAFNRGLGHDGVHPSLYVEGSGVLTARGLQCGHNVRNYVTLRMLQQVVAALRSSWLPGGYRE